MNNALSVLYLWVKWIKFCLTCDTQTTESPFKDFREKDIVVWNFIVGVTCTCVVRNKKGTVQQ